VETPAAAASSATNRPRARLTAGPPHAGAARRHRHSHGYGRPRRRVETPRYTGRGPPARVATRRRWGGKVWHPVDGAHDDAEPIQVHDVLVDVREVADHDGAARSEAAPKVGELPRPIIVCAAPAVSSVAQCGGPDRRSAIARDALRGALDATTTTSGAARPRGRRVGAATAQNGRHTTGRRLGGLRASHIHRCPPEARKATAHPTPWTTSSHASATPEPIT
jgi:hypothetical protein